MHYWGGPSCPGGPLAHERELSFDRIEKGRKSGQMAATASVSSVRGIPSRESSPPAPVPPPFVPWLRPTLGPPATGFCSKIRPSIVQHRADF